MQIQSLRIRQSQVTTDALKGRVRQARQTEDMLLSWLSKALYITTSLPPKSCWELLYSPQFNQTRWSSDIWINYDQFDTWGGITNSAQGNPVGSSILFQQVLTVDTHSLPTHTGLPLKKKKNLPYLSYLPLSLIHCGYFSKKKIAKNPRLFFFFLCSSRIFLSSNFPH